MAEDDDNDFALIERSVRKLDIDVELRRAANGQIAIQLLEEAIHTQPFLVMLDVKMPKVSGLEVLHAIRQNPATQHLPAVMLTSSDESADLHEAYRLGCNAYLRKPILYAEFVDTVKCTLLFWLQVRIPDGT